MEPGHHNKQPAEAWHLSCFPGASHWQGSGRSGLWVDREDWGYFWEGRGEEGTMGCEGLATMVPIWTYLFKSPYLFPYSNIQHQNSWHMFKETHWRLSNLPGGKCKNVLTSLLQVIQSFPCPRCKQDIALTFLLWLCWHQWRGTGLDCQYLISLALFKIQLTSLSTFPRPPTFTTIESVCGVHLTHPEGFLRPGKVMQSLSRPQKTLSKASWEATEGHAQPFQALESLQDATRRHFQSRLGGQARVSRADSESNL